MAKISTIREVIRLCGKAGVTPFIWGHRGLGKSALVQQEAGENRMGFIDMRCSQMEASDVRGLPKDGDDGRTHYLPPADMPIGDMTSRQITEELAKVLSVDLGLAGAKMDDAIVRALSKADLQLTGKYEARLQMLQPNFERGIIFLDEVNRAQDDVQQAIFQLVLDRSVGQYVLPPGWIIVAAGNFMEGYQVTGFTDPAFLDRFCHVTLSGGETTLEEWVDYMADQHGEWAADVIEFASHNTDHLDGKIEGELGFSVQPSRRSWERVTKIHKICEEDGGFSDIAKTECYAGLVGRELAIAFSRYECPVKPRDLLNKGVKAHQKALKTLTRNQLTGVMWGMVAFCKNQIEKDHVSEVCLDFAQFICDNVSDKDVVVAFCRALISSGSKADQQEKARAAVLSNPKLATMVSNFDRKGGGKKMFIDRLASRPDLQDALSRVSWGIDD